MKRASAFLFVGLIEGHPHRIETKNRGIGNIGRNSDAQRASRPHAALR